LSPVSLFMGIIFVERMIDILGLMASSESLSRSYEFSSNREKLEKQMYSACMRIEDSNGDTPGTQVTDIKMDRLVKGAILIISTVYSYAILIS
jgi:hypothetical protein